ncbi:uncharacterized protein LOC120441444 [Oreochromis aureus]|uniref:uncharacterized protein LOC120441444 n=1 Tax=Oreochromis aureus TaxID=47969 RepID=UPI0019540906|nr:uncharacterized protein LOC120441444 [Oreochromis aureus]
MHREAQSASRRLWGATSAGTKCPPCTAPAAASGAGCVPCPVAVGFPLAGGCNTCWSRVCLHWRDRGNASVVILSTICSCYSTSTSPPPAVAMLPPVELTLPEPEGSEPKELSEPGALTEPALLADKGPPGMVGVDLLGDWPHPKSLPHTCC